MSRHRPHHRPHLRRHRLPPSPEPLLWLTVGAIAVVVCLCLAGVFDTLL